MAFHQDRRTRNDHKRVAWNTVSGQTLLVVLATCSSAPLTHRDAGVISLGIKGYWLLTGYRGQPSADLEALEQTLFRVSHLVEEIPEASELDLNPIIALPPGQGCRIVERGYELGRLKSEHRLRDLRP